MTIDVINFGCRLNQNEGAEVKKQAENAGLSDVIILNSCAVTSEAERQLRQTIRKMSKQYPEKKIIVTGCAAQISPERYSAMTEVDIVIGNIEKMSKNTYDNIFAHNTEKLLVNDIMSVRDTAHYMPDLMHDRVRSFLQIQNGCNHRCTFCIIPYGRGNSRSVPLGEIISNATALVERGIKEIVLTGVDLTDYGSDLPGNLSFTEAIERILKNIPNLPRLRLSSVDVAELNDDFIHLFATEKRLMPYLHLSLQSGDDMILKRMKRRHNRSQVIEFCDRIKKLRPETEFGADIIAGFPTETDDMFNNTVDLLSTIKTSYLHVFPYSARNGTPASKMPQVPLNIRKSRAAAIRELGSKILIESNSKKIGKVFNVLVENGSLSGKAEDFSTVRLNSDRKLMPGEIVTCIIEKQYNDYIIASVL